MAAATARGARARGKQTEKMRWRCRRVLLSLFYSQGAGCTMRRTRVCPASEDL